MSGVKRRGRRGGDGRRYPRVARVNEVLRQVVAEELERLADQDVRLLRLTVTAVEAEADLRHARVLLDSLDEPAEDALAESRVRLQAAIGRQVRLKRTPQLTFVPDPAVAHGRRVEAVLRDLARRQGGPGSPPPGEGP
ncbi:MAG TPA: ribosome-binding factor A [Acidimicrobiales bacterium]|nr:ribosome-binding factor A [Acidimicrobiales bacterium]